MGIVVQKYGGSSVGSAEKIASVAEKVVRTQREGHQVVVVVSAMGGRTDQLLTLARAVSDNPDPRELDMLLSSGERESTALLAMAIRRLGQPAVSLTGRACQIRTDDRHGSASILEIDPSRIQRELAAGHVVVAAGFQGVNTAGEVTTLGRGGSDTTAVALAAALSAERCDIFSDVDGVYSADPRVVPTAHRLEQLCYEEMQELARQGARVLNAEAVEFARRTGITICARSTFGGSEYSVINGADGDDRASGVSGVAGRGEVLHIRYNGGPKSDDFMRAVGVQNVVCSTPSERALQVLVHTENIPSAEEYAEALCDQFEGHVDVAPNVGSVAAVGRGIGRDKRLHLRAKDALRNAGVDVLAHYTTNDSITCVVPSASVKAGVLRVHQALIDTSRNIHAPASVVA